MKSLLGYLLLLNLIGNVRTQGLDDKAPAYQSLKTANFDLLIDPNSQVLVSLKPRESSAPDVFDFLPFDNLVNRSANGNHHFGDVSFRTRLTGSSDDWANGDSAQDRKTVHAEQDSHALASADLGATLPSNATLQITRRWVDQGGDLALMFDVKNTADAPVEIGSLGMPIVSNNIITNRDADNQYANLSFADPDFGLNGGYVRVTRINGQGPALAITPINKDSSFEGWNFIHEEMGSLEYQSQTFEGLYEWQPVSKAWAENEWKNVTPWNEPSSVTLKSGESRTFGLLVSLVDEIENIDDKLLDLGQPVASSIPGFIIPTDLDSRLYLNYSCEVQNITTEPEHALTFTQDSSDSASGWSVYVVNATNDQVWGRVRATVTYSDGMKHALQYYVTKSFPTAMQDLGDFHSTTMWFNDSSDPFKRAPAPITYDREKNQQVTEENRTYVAGIDDEGGSGAQVALSGKQLLHPNAEEVSKYLTFINETLWGDIQHRDGSEDEAYGVIKSLFYYDNVTQGFSDYDPDIDWSTSWNTTEAHRLDRSYNYPWVTSAYWSMYRVLRSHADLATGYPEASWYLSQAAKTISFMAPAPGEEPKTAYWDLGLMGETTFGYVLNDLESEDMTDLANDLRMRMKRRADLWNNQTVPYGSEQAWDNTGQEGVYYWSKYFGYNETAAKTLQTILGYTPTVNHWGYDGNSRRYWDFFFAGKLRRFERQLHHYGSAFNSLPVLDAYKAAPSKPATTGAPDPTYLLRLGYAGLLGSMSNIDQEGFAAAAFHAFPDTLKWDGYSADYGQGLWGMVLNSVSVLLEHPTFGWVAYGANWEVDDTAKTITMHPRDVARQKVYLAPLGLELRLEHAGVFDEVVYFTSNKTVKATILPSVPGVGAADADFALLALDTRSGDTQYTPSQQTEKAYGAWKYMFNDGKVVIDVEAVA